MLLSDDEVNDLYEYSEDEDEAILPFDQNEQQSTPR